MFSCEFSEIFKSSFFIEHLPWLPLQVDSGNIETVQNIVKTFNSHLSLIKIEQVFNYQEYFKSNRLMCILLEY